MTKGGRTSGQCKQKGRDMLDLPVQAEVTEPALTRAETSSAAAGIEDARLAASRFLKKQPGVKYASITRLGRAAADKGCWEAEAEVYIPNTTIRMLGLRVRRQVLDRRLYVLRLDSELNVVSYEFKEPGEASD